MPLNLDSVKKVAYVAVPLLCVAGGIAIGWAAKPEVVRVEETVRVETVEKQVVAIQERVRVETVYVKEAVVVDRWHREKTSETKPDGTVIAKEVEDRNIDSHTSEHKTDTEVKVVEVTKEVVVTQEVVREIKTEPVLANWHFGIKAGAAPRFDIPTETAIMLGAEVEHRLFGPVWGGIWVLGGSPVSRFDLQHASGGISVSFEL
jgi:hypothetical protein